ncbi:XrtA system polysaccharide chain length determinant [Allosphingosinicella deserti]|uniref:Chain-length determining protein n=1 Tax=Allosphingosinicella deserti TaxID=2116704 RepID=A0A2P7QPG4_9SPHN|nr:XrtA system polysaccharide chain length determinant [Sphingomonas deserti]PSJ39862.1 chain-length determining protein [Sphingomonas deserti]
MDGLYEQLRIALHQVWRRRWLALGAAWGLCLVGWLVVALIPNSYESKARVFVQLQSILPTQVGITAADRQNDITRIKQTLTSTDNLEKVVRRTELNNLVATKRDLAVQVDALRKVIKVTAQQDNLFEISATSSISGFSNGQNAKLAAGIVQNLLDLFVEANLSGDRDEATESLTFLDEQLQRREQDLQAAEQRRVEFEQKYLGVLPGEGSIGSRMAAARAELSGIEQQLMQAQSSLVALRSQLGSTPPTLPGIAGADNGSVSSQLTLLQAQLAQAAARGWTDAHPDVVALKAQIARLRPLAAREGPSGAAGMPNPAYSSLRGMVAEREAQVQASSVRKAQLDADLAELSSKQATEPGVAAQQAQLNRDYEVLKRQYDKLLEDREQVRLRSDVQSKTAAVKFKVIDPPSAPRIPTSPDRPILLTAILFAALAAGVGLAFVWGQLQTTFPTQGRLEAITGLPVLGSISEVVTDAVKARRRQHLLWLGGGGGALAASYALLMAVEFWQRSTVA